LIWTAGHLPEGIPAVSPIENQVEQVLDNLEVTLESAGAGFDTVLQTHVYLTDFADWQSFNRIYVERFGEFGLPPRTTVEVSELGLGYAIEIEMVAHVRE
jgi:enamine deaminase RidA (YjgF/YER057c/UK114 family)